MLRRLRARHGRCHGDPAPIAIRRKRQDLSRGRQSGFDLDAAALHVLDVDLDAFVARHQELLRIERAEEIAQQERLLRTRSEAELEQRGVLLRRLEVADLEPGLGGALHALLQQSRGGSLPPHRFAPGDVVSVDGADGEPVTNGLVASVRYDRVTVALDDRDDLDLPSIVRLRRLVPDITFRRMHEALQRLRNAAAPERRKFVEACFVARDPEYAERPKLESPIDAALDASQQSAVAHALAAEQIALIHGPPGTGKTTAVVEVIRQAVLRGESVLASAPSNVAVDNLAERLLHKGMRIVRIGQPVRVLPAVVDQSLAVQVQNAPEQKLLRDVRQELRELQRRWLRASRSERFDLKREQKRLRNEQRTLENAIVQGLLDTADVVLATTTGCGDWLLQDRVFDLVVLDEAAQALEAASWLPLGLGKRAVLAGDHCQLPPTVHSEAAAKGGLATTLFERLAASSTGAQMTRMLTTQYRMHEAIQRWSSATFYESRLVPADLVKAHRLCDLPEVAETEDTSCPLLFLDTAGCGHDETEGDDDGSKSNPGEAAIAAGHVARLIEAGVRADQIAVVTPYSAQVRLLRDRLSGYEGLEVGTIDGLQGREKEAIVLSLVRSNERGEVGFLAELRRLNVAMTRARRHLCVIADSATIAQHDDIAKVVDWLQTAGEHRSAWGLGGAQ